MVDGKPELDEFKGINISILELIVCSSLSLSLSLSHVSSYPIYLIVNNYWSYTLLARDYNNLLFYLNVERECVLWEEYNSSTFLQNIPQLANLTSILITNLLSQHKVPVILKKLLEG
jgi:hypothetical protein